MANFERAYYEQTELWNRDFLAIPAERERIIQTIALIPTDVLSILDVGCGNGAFLNSLPAMYQAVGLDSSHEALKYVKTKAIQGDIASLPFESASFDLVTCLEVLEHLPSTVFERALSEIERVSRKYIIISVPNSEPLDYSLVICPSCRCWYNPHRHVRSFTPERLRTLFSSKFKLSVLKEIGPLEPYPTYNRFLYAAYRLWRSAPPPSTAVCPQCGYQTHDSTIASTPEQQGFLRYMLKLIKLPAKAIWRPRWSHRWLLALYERNNFEELTKDGAIR
ncbi:MAG: class I SAM-dependent methyltransferase [Candidatus Bathyarchaeia archaeon]